MNNKIVTILGGFFFSAAFLFAIATVVVIINFVIGFIVHYPAYGIPLVVFIWTCLSWFLYTQFNVEE